MAAGYREVRGKTGLWGTISRILFWGWQGLMVFWLFAYAADVAPLLNTPATQAEQVGAGIGATIAVGTIVFFWLSGSVILGLFVLFTRGPKILVPLGEPLPARRMSSAVKTIIAFGVLALVVGLIEVGSHSNHRPSPKTDTAANQSASSTALSDSWSYSDQEDTISGKTIKEATISSKEPIEFSFPYGGPQYPRLIVRNHPRYGNNIILSIDRGQFICNDENCGVTVRFDNGKPERFAGVEPSDNSTTVIFIQNYRRFVEELEKARVVIIEAEFYQEGPRQIEFDIAAFDPKKL
jgi:hypothetical protein